MSESREFLLFDARLQTTVAFHEAVAVRLADPWVPEQQASRVAVPRYLDMYREEVYDGLFHARLDFDQWRTYHDGLEAFARDHPNSDVARIFKASRLSVLERTYAGRNGKHPSLEQAACYMALHRLATRTSGGQMAQRSVDALYSVEGIDPVVRQMVHADLDGWVYKGGFYSRDFAAGFKVSELASSRAAATAIRGAYDHKLLKKALKDYKTDEGLATATVEHFASSPEAREAMLGHLALYGEGRKSHSTGWYPRRITDQFKYDFHRRSLDEELRKLRENQEEARRQREREYAKERQRLIDDEEALRDALGDELYEEMLRIFGGDPDVNSEPRGQTIDKRMRHAVRQAPHKTRHTLEGIMKSDPDVIRDLIATVDTYQAAEPDITARQVYRRLYRSAHMNEATRRELDMLTTFDLFLGGHKPMGDKTHKGDGIDLPFGASGVAV